MLRTQLSRQSILSALVGLSLLVPTALSVSAASDDPAVAGVTVSSATTTQSAPMSAAQAGNAYEASPNHPSVTRTSVGWEIDRGGPGVYLDRFVDDGD